MNLVVPNEERQEVATISYANVYGEGAYDYTAMKSEGKDGGREYVATLSLTKEQKKDFLKDVMEFWEEEKPKSAGNEPANFEKIVRKEEDGQLKLYTKTKTEFSGKVNIIPIVNHEGTRLDGSEFGLIGDGSKGRLAVILSLQEGKAGLGVSVYLNAIKLTKFVAPASNGASAFGKEDGEVEATGGFKNEPTSEDEPKKKKKKKKSKK